MIKQVPPSVPADGAPDLAIDRAMKRIINEIQDGLRHGFFEFTLTCEIIGQERRRLTLWAGKSYQFVIPRDDCLRTASDKSDS